VSLTSIGSELKKAQQGNYAIPLLEFLELSGSEELFASIEKKRAPAIIGVYSGTLKKTRRSAVVACLKTMAAEATVPVSIMLDHGQSFEDCMEAIRDGFTDVMYDGSKLSFEENVRVTRDVVRAAHAVGVCVEAELGHVGSGAEYTEFGAKRKGFTDPDDVEKFVAQTGVDFLAIAVGTAHGVYKGEPAIDTGLLSRIRGRVDVPLVLHGGTGLSDGQFRDSIRAGISKINIATDFAVSAFAAMKKTANEEAGSYFKVMRSLHESVTLRADYFLDLFGTSGKAA